MKPPRILVVDDEPDVEARISQSFRRKVRIRILQTIESDTTRYFNDEFFNRIRPNRQEKRRRIDDISDPQAREE